MRITAFILLYLALAATPLHAQNLVFNGRFNVVQLLDGWEDSTDPDMTLAWTALDANASATSGSMRVTNTAPGQNMGVTAAQCIPAYAGLGHSVGGKVRIPSGSEQSINNRAVMSLRWYSDPECTVSIGGVITANGSPTSFDVWVTQSMTATAPAGARSVEVRALVTKYTAGGSFVAQFDDITLTSQMILQDGFE